MSERWGGWSFSPHARERMAEMGVKAEEVIEVLAWPQNDYPQGHRGEGRRMAHGETLGVVYEEASRRIITVIWRLSGEERTFERGKGAPTELVQRGLKSH